MKNAARLVVIVLCLVFSASALYNVFSDNREVEALAARAACGDAAACEPRLVELARTPFGQSMRYVVGKAEVPVTCRRAAVLVGPYACTRN